MTLFQGTDDHRRAGHRQRKTEHHPCHPTPVQDDGQRHGAAHGDHDLPDGTAKGRPFHGQQILDGKMQPDAEHQQDDAHIGKFGGQMGIGHEPRRKWPHHDASQQIASHGG